MELGGCEKLDGFSRQVKLVEVGGCDKMDGFSRQVKVGSGFRVSQTWCQRQLCLDVRMLNLKS